MKFSVLMSVYENDNVDFLREAINSIYEGQSQKPDEVVIVKDGIVKENVSELLQQYYKKYPHIFKIIPLETNMGLGIALAEGLKYCQYEWIARMDADDISHKKRFEKQINYIKKHPYVDAVGGYISEFNKSIREDMRIRYVPKTQEDILSMTKSRNPMNHVTVMMRKDAVIASGGYQSLLYLEDYYLWVRMIAKGFRLANINEVLVYVRIGNGFTKRRSDRNRISGWWILQKYMINKKMISLVVAIKNMINIFGFVYCPQFVKKIAYNHFLRR